ncbi:VanZ family protein [Kitasatospora sp. CB01950]|uniref:VanZ family protein n=1 Tax=Kitasatospora sp. CB01950 TaxID=1703930 RepID=UPI00093A5947|nr:VanZ family protein [Kitasatospora sp. CB01950]
MLLTLHLLALGWLALRPVSAPWTGPPNLTPFATVHQDLAVGGLTAARRLAAGLLPLAPVGILLPLAVGTPRRAWWLSFLRTTGAVALLATALEFLEGWAPGNVLNVDDILLGTVGATATHLLLMPPLRALATRRPAGAPRAATPPRQENPKERTQAPARPAPAPILGSGRVQPFR